MGLLPVKLQRAGLALELTLNDGQTVTFDNYYAPAMQEATAQRAKAYASKSLGNSQTVRAKQLLATAKMLSDAQKLQDGESLEGAQLIDVGPLRNVWQVWQEISTNLSGLANSAAGTNEALSPQWNDANQSNTAMQADYLKGTSADTSLQSKEPVSPEMASLWGLARIGLPVAALVALLPSGSSSSTLPKASISLTKTLPTENGLTAAEATAATGMVSLGVTSGATAGTTVTLTFTSDAPNSKPVTQTYLANNTTPVLGSLKAADLTQLVPDGKTHTITVTASAPDIPSQTVEFTYDPEPPETLNFVPVDKDGNVLALRGAITLKDITFKIFKGSFDKPGVTEEGATWQWSRDSGKTWTDGVGSTFTVSNATATTTTFTGDEIQVRQMDVAGNIRAPEKGGGILNLKDTNSTITLETVLPIINEANIDARPHTTFIKSLSGTDASGAITWALADANDPTFTLSSTGVLRFRQLPDAIAQDWEIKVKATDIVGNEATSTLHVYLPAGTDNPVVELTDSNLAGVTQSEAKEGAFKFWAQEGSTIRVVLTNANDSSKTVTIDGLNAPASGAQTTVALTDEQISQLGNGSIRVVVSSARVGATTSSEPATFTLDTSAPNAPLVKLVTDSAPAIAAAGSPLLSDGISNVGTVHVGVEPGASWKWRVTKVGETAKDSWNTGTGSSFAALPGPEAYVYEVQQTDAAGNVGGTTTRTFTISPTSNPPGSPLLSLQADAGASSTDRITSNGTVLVAGLKTEALWEWRSTADGSATASAWTTGTGSTFTPSTEGKAVYEVRQYDLAGNVSASATLNAFTWDKTIANPTLAMSVDTGKVGDGITRNHVLNVGGVESGASWFWKVVNAAGELLRDWTAGSGSSFEPVGADGLTLPDGSYSVSVYASDVAGNSSQAAPAQLALTFNTNDIVKAFVTGITTDEGSSGTDFITKDTTLVYTGALDKALGAGQKVQIRVDGGPWRDASSQPALAALTFSDDATGTVLAEGAHLVDVRVVDSSSPPIAVAGSESSQALTVDTTIKPLTLAMVKDTGKVGDGITRDHNFTVGNIETGASWFWKVTGGAVPLKTEWTQGTGSSFEPLNASNGTLADGSYTIQVYTKDLAGNSNDAADKLTSLSVTFNSNATNPIPYLASISDDTGTAADFKTKDTTLSYAGVLDKALLGGQKVQIEIAGPAFTVPWKDVSTQPGASGTDTALTFSHDDSVTTLANGVYTVNLRVVDSSGALVANSQTTQQVTVDTSIASPSVAMAVDTGEVGDGITRNHNFNVSNVEAGANWYWKVTKLVGGVTTTEHDWTQGTGSSFEPLGASNATLPDGSYTIHVYAMDAAGNSTENTPTSLPVTFNTNANPITKITALVSDRGAISGWETNDTTLSYNGTLDTPLASGQKVQIHVGGGSWKDVSQQPASGALSFSSSETATPLSVGDHVVEVRVVDASGTALDNTLSSQLITVLPTVTFGSMSPDTGAAADWSGSFKKLSFSGTLSVALSASTTLQVNVDGGTWTAVTPASGVTAWTYDNTANTLTTGSHTLNYRMVNADGTQLTDSSGSRAFTVVNPVNFSVGTGIAAKPNLFTAVEAGALYLVDKTAFSASTTLSVDALGNMQFINSGTTVAATDAQFNKLLVTAAETNFAKAVDYTTLTTGRDYALYWQPDGFAGQLIAINNNLTNNTPWLSNS